MKIILSENDVPLGAAITCKLANIPFTWGKDTCLPLNEHLSLESSHAISRHIARLNPPLNLYPSDILHRTEVDHWLSLSSGPFSCKNEISSILNQLNKALAPSTFLTANNLTIADIEIYCLLYNNKEWLQKISEKTAPPHVLRWYNHVNKKVESIIKSFPASVSIVKASKDEIQTSKREEGGKFVDLPGAKMGEVVVRFPPEASGYLHIGHAKAALLNQYYQKAFKGQLIMRFDDTNPAKETEEFEKVILEDVKLLEIEPDRFTHTSDYFDLMIKMCQDLIKNGKAYADDTDPETMKKERDERKESKNRNNSAQKNLQMWNEMKKGSQIGICCCIRAKIDMNSHNGCMRDPTIYRCKDESHIRTGNKYKVYPTYDFACPIVDSLEGVTHALRTTEYHDRDDQYYWFIKNLSLRSLHIYEYSRLNMNNTVLSKRKLTWFVNEKIVDGWDDPRFPTVRGILRRGMTIEGLKDFIIAQGSSRSVVNMEWDKIWAFNKKVIDRDASRYTALQGNLIPVMVNNAKEESKQAQKHPKDPSKGTKTLWVGPKILIEEEDAKDLKVGENATFINWGNIKILKINKKEDKIIDIEAETNLSDTNYKKTLKLTWLSDTEKASFTPVVCVYFDHIISKSVLGKDEDFKNFINNDTMRQVSMFGDHDLKELKVGEIIQIQRKGFFRVDEAYKPFSPASCREGPVVLFAIPDGHTKEVSSTNKNMSTKEIQQSAKGKLAEKSPQEECKPVALSVSLDIHSKIKSKGDEIRILKANKADKAAILSEVDILKSLKSQFKEATGVEWKPDIDINQFAKQESAIPNISTKVETSNSNENIFEIHNKIKDQGDKVRNLKSAKADKATIMTEVNILKALKTDFKDASGIEWKPDIDINQFKQNIVSNSNVTESEEAVSQKDTLNIHEKIKEQGNKVRSMKEAKADKDSIKAQVDILLELKKEFKSLTNVDWKPDINITSIQIGAITDSVKDSSSASKRKSKETTLPSKKVGQLQQEETSGKKQTRLGLEAKKDENFSVWYSQVITKSEMIEYYNVSGCYILRPWSYAIWDTIKAFLDAEIKKLGVENAYFPIFVSKEALEREKTHIADFSPEVAWVTRSGSSEMAEPVAIRPTSETVMYPAFAKWIQSHRDLPMKINQWNNVVRWEFKQPTPFLRTREFLWQEGHSAFASKEEAVEEVYAILESYARVYEELLAIPVVRGRKTEKEKFAGGDFTTTTEAYILSSGRGIQGATSHHLGQNFSKMFNIVYEDPKTQEEQFVYQNSWGLTTRTIGVMVMVHGDNKGLVLPPRVASIQVVIMPVGITAKSTESDKEMLIKACDKLKSELIAGGIRAHCDFRDNVTPAWKFNHWELKGVPLRIEFGPKEIGSGQIFTVRRDTGEKQHFNRTNMVSLILELLETIQKTMYNKALAHLDDHKIIANDWTLFLNNLNIGNLTVMPFCGEEECEDAIKRDSAKDESTEPGAPSMGAKALCIPFKQPGSVENLRCIYPQCSRKPKYYTMFGRSY